MLMNFFAGVPVISFISYTGFTSLIPVSLVFNDFYTPDNLEIIILSLNGFQVKLFEPNLISLFVFLAKKLEIHLVIATLCFFHLNSNDRSIRKENGRLWKFTFPASK